MKVLKIIKEVIRKILAIVLPIVFFGWVIIVLIDYYNASQNKDPNFCLSKETKEYSDGNVNICTGLGYKVYNYKRASYSAIEFGPFWLEERQ